MVHYVREQYKFERKTVQGQSVVEYLVLMVVVFGFIGLLLPRLPRTIDRIQAMMGDKFKSAYRYGDRDAKGWDDGGPTRQALLYKSGNFRIFRRMK